MSIDSDQLRTLEAQYEDFHGFLDEKDWINAEASIQNMKEFSEEEAQRMSLELQDAKHTHNA